MYEFIRRTGATYARRSPERDFEKAVFSPVFCFFVAHLNYNTKVILDAQFCKMKPELYHMYLSIYQLWTSCISGKDKLRVAAWRCFNIETAFSWIVVFIIKVVLQWESM